MVENSRAKMHIVALTLFTALLLLSAIAQAANITVSTSRNPVALDDSFHIIYEADNSVDDDPDFTPIYKDFDVLSSSQSTNMRSINGNWSLKKSWDLTVIAKDVGKFTIPPISFGKDISPAIQVTVRNSSSPNSLSPDGQSTIPAKIFLESSIDKRSGWVQSQFIYTVRLLRTVSIAGASITAPETSDPDAIIQQIAEDNYQTTRNGIRYEVYERRYAIFPQKSGRLKINPATFEGRVNATQPRSIFDQFRMSGQLKRLRSKAVDITVKAAPGNINLQDWLPASDVRLVEQWSGNIQNLTAGEPVTRTITIEADGLTGVQLPELSFDDIDGLKQYPDKAVEENSVGANGITGRKQIKLALIPGRTGNYTLPEVRLQWWNTKTDRAEVATLPQTVINVLNGSTVGRGQIRDQIDDVQPASLPQPQSEPGDSTTTLPLQPEAAGQQAKSAVDALTPYWKWAALFFAIAWLITLILLFRRSPQGSTDTAHSAKVSLKTHNASVKKYIAEVKRYAAGDDALKTRDAVISWAQLAYEDDEITNLSQLSAYCSPAFAEQVRKLNESLYSSAQPEWQGDALLKVFTDEIKLDSGKRDGGKHGSASSLKPLYQS